MPELPKPTVEQIASDLGRRTLETAAGTFSDLRLQLSKFPLPLFTGLEKEDQKIEALVALEERVAGVLGINQPTPADRNAATVYVYGFAVLGGYYHLDEVYQSGHKAEEISVGMDAIAGLALPKRTIPLRQVGLEEALQDCMNWMRRPTRRGMGSFPVQKALEIFLDTVLPEYAQNHRDQTYNAMRITYDALFSAGQPVPEKIGSVFLDENRPSQPDLGVLYDVLLGSFLNLGAVADTLLYPSHRDEFGQFKDVTKKLFATEQIADDIDFGLSFEYKDFTQANPDVGDFLAAPQNQSQVQTIIETSTNAAVILAALITSRDGTTTIISPLTLSTVLMMSSDKRTIVDQSYKLITKALLTHGVNLPENATMSVVKFLVERTLAFLSGRRDQGGLGGFPDFPGPGGGFGPWGSDDDQWRRGPDDSRKPDPKPDPVTVT